MQCMQSLLTLPIYHSSVQIKLSGPKPQHGNLGFKRSYPVTFVVFFLVVTNVTFCHVASWEEKFFLGILFYSQVALSLMFSDLITSLYERLTDSVGH